MTYQIIKDMTTEVPIVVINKGAGTKAKVVMTLAEWSYALANAKVILPEQPVEQPVEQQVEQESA